MLCYESQHLLWSLSSGPENAIIGSERLLDTVYRYAGTGIGLLCKLVQSVEDFVDGICLCVHQNGVAVSFWHVFRAKSYFVQGS